MIYIYICIQVKKQATFESFYSFWSIFGKIIYSNISKLPQQERYLDSEVIDHPHLGMNLKKGQVLHGMEKCSGKVFTLITCDTCSTFTYESEQVIFTICKELLSFSDTNQAISKPAIGVQVYSLQDLHRKCRHNKARGWGICMVCPWFLSFFASRIQLGKECQNGDVSSESKAKLRLLEQTLKKQLGRIDWYRTDSIAEVEDRAWQILDHMLHAWQMRPKVFQPAGTLGTGHSRCLNLQNLTELLYIGSPSRLGIPLHSFCLLPLFSPVSFLYLETWSDFPDPNQYAEATKPTRWTKSAKSTNPPTQQSQQVNHSRRFDSDSDAFVFFQVTEEEAAKDKEAKVGLAVGLPFFCTRELWGSDFSLGHRSQLKLRNCQEPASKEEEGKDEELCLKPLLHRCSSNRSFVSPELGWSFDQSVVDMYLCLFVYVCTYMCVCIHILGGDFQQFLFLSLQMGDDPIWLLWTGLKPSPSPIYLYSWYMVCFEGLISDTFSHSPRFFFAADGKKKGVTRAMEISYYQQCRVHRHHHHYHHHQQQQKQKQQQLLL